MEKRRSDDENLTAAEKRAIFLKKYGLTGALALISPMLIPIAIEWIAGTVVDAQMRPVMDKLSAMERRIDGVHDEVLYSRAYASSSSMKTLVTSEDFNIMVRHRIRSQSLDKIKEIKEVLSYSDVSTENGKKTTWTKVKNILYRNTNIYVNEMKNYGHPVAGSIGLFLGKTFPMHKDKNRDYRPKYSFMNIVYKITIESKDRNVDKIADNLEEYMKAIQSEYFDDMTLYLKGLESKAKVNITKVSHRRSI